MTARELRVWHWRRALAARDAARRYKHLAKSKNRLGDFHLKAVQVLNDHPDCIAGNTTAEQDDLIFPVPHNRVPKDRR